MQPSIHEFLSFLSKAGGPVVYSLATNKSHTSQQRRAMRHAPQIIVVGQGHRRSRYTGKRPIDSPQLGRFSTQSPIRYWHWRGRNPSISQRAILEGRWRRGKLQNFSNNFGLDGDDQDTGVAIHETEVKVDDFSLFVTEYSPSTDSAYGKDHTVVCVLLVHLCAGLRGRALCRSTTPSSSTTSSSSSTSTT